MCMLCSIFLVLAPMTHPCLLSKRSSPYQKLLHVSEFCFSSSLLFSHLSLCNAEQGCAALHEDGAGSVPLRAAAMTVQKIVEKIGFTQYNGIEIF